MLDTIRVNSKSLWCIKHGKDSKKANTFDVGLDLAHSLVMTFIQQRSLVGLRKPLLKKISYIKNTNFHQKQSQLLGTEKDVKRVRPYVEAKLKRQTWKIKGAVRKLW